MLKKARWAGRKNEVKEAFLFSYRNYLKLAYPMDELRPVTGAGVNKFKGWAVTVFDSLDTMWLMGLKDEFYQAMDIVEKTPFTSLQSEFAPFFETTIRYLGGLLSAYALSKEPVFLVRANELGKRLIPVFDSHSSGLPSYGVNTETGETQDQQTMLWAEATSCQLEFKYLAKLTGTAEYYHKVERIMEFMYATNSTEGLFAEKWLLNGQQVPVHVGVGGGMDSGYEYLLKQWLLNGDTKAKAQYITSITGIINNLLFITPNRQLLYVTDTRGGLAVDQFEHLSCFLPGVIALGAHTLDLSPDEKELHQWAARGLAYSCYVSYADQTSGLGPDNMMMKSGGKWIEHVQTWIEEGRPGNVPPGVKASPPVKEGDRDYFNANQMWYARPETIESLYLMWKTTGEEVWRERGYEIFAAIEKHARTEFGYSSIFGVDYKAIRPWNEMPSYFLAETLKYLYLLFDDEDPIDLKKWVFNTEAHPLPVYEWEEWEKVAYNVSGVVPPKSLDLEIGLEDMRP
ncbi:glycoside hydrolase family 47 protein [Pluteus cervinus]|uniref:Glycoside hydrolase family 47 protein n=1 Tax=Pluteus cervinus TaxID=181527 RepID=A0ACD3ANQ8_9AGAR|nr:glycoside hydrolase family 47 protein [Pluteus cervinus]